MAAQNPERHRLIEKSDEHIAKLPHSKELRSLSSDHDVQKLIERVAEEAREAQKRRERWMLRKAGDRVQALAKRVSEFLAAYSGIIEVVKNVAGEKAQVPYTAISILFIVAVNKTGIEEHIESTLNSITLAFPDLAQICDIVDYSRLHPSLERLTENVIAYSSAAAHYYNRRWFSRLWYVIGHPPNAELDTLKEAIDSDAKAIKNSTYRYTVEKLQYLVNAAEEQRQYAEEQRQLAEELRKDAERRRQAEEGTLQASMTMNNIDWRKPIFSQMRKHCFKSTHPRPPRSTHTTPPCFLSSTCLGPNTSSLTDPFLIVRRTTAGRITSIHPCSCYRGPPKPPTARASRGSP